MLARRMSGPTTTVTTAGSGSSPDSGIGPAPIISCCVSASMSPLVSSVAVVHCCTSSRATEQTLVSCAPISVGSDWGNTWMSTSDNVMSPRAMTVMDSSSLAYVTVRATAVAISGGNSGSGGSWSVSVVMSGILPQLGEFFAAAVRACWIALHAFVASPATPELCHNEEMVLAVEPAPTALPTAFTTPV